MQSLSTALSSMTGGKKFLSLSLSLFSVYVHIIWLVNFILTNNFIVPTIHEMVLEFSSPSMKQEDMNDGGGESSEADAISHSKEGAERERPILFVGIHVKLKVGVDNA